MTPSDASIPLPAPPGPEGLLGAFFEGFAHALAVMGEEGSVHWANSAARRLLGLDPPQLWRGPFLDAHGHPLAVHPALEAIRAHRALAPVEVGLPSEEGDISWVELSVTPLRPGVGMVTCVDLGERHRLEGVLEARTRLAALAPGLRLDELLRATLDEAERLTGSCIGFYHFLEADQERLHLQAWSTRTEREFCRAEGKGQHYAVDHAGVWADCIRERRPIVHNDYAALPHRKGLPPGHASVLREVVVPVFREDTIVAILGVGNRATPYRDSDVATLQVLADLAWDLAVAKRDEERCRQWDEDHLAMLRNVPGAVYRREMAFPWRMDFCSHGMHALTGLAAEQFLSGAHALGDLVHPEDRQGVMEALDAAARGGRQFELTYRILGQDGRERWAKDRGRVHLDAFGMPIAAEGVILDITAEHLAETVLAAQRDELDTLFQTSPDLLVLATLEGTFLRVNPQWERVLGHPMPDKDGVRLLDFVHPEDRADTEAVLSILGTQEEVIGFVNRYRDARGGYHWLEWKATPRGHLIYAAARDITEQKAADAALRASELRARSMLRTALDGVWLLDAEARFLDVNEAAQVMLGYPREALLGQSVSLVEANEDPAAVTEHLERLQRQGIDRFESRHRRKDGTVIPVEVSVTYLPDTGQMVAFVRDIRDRMAAEMEHRRFENLVQTVDGIVWEADAETFRFTFVSRRAEAMLGYPVEAWLEPGFWAAHLHGEDRDLTVASCLAATSHQEDHVLEYRFLAADGRVVWLRDLVTVVCEDGKPRWLRGLLVDTTALKASEDALRRSESRFRSLLDAAATPIVITDLQGRIEHLNRHFIQAFGYGADRLPDLDAWWPQAFPDPLYRVQVRRMWEEAFQAGLEVEGEIHPTQVFEITCADGSLRTVEIRGALSVDRMILVFHDLTDHLATMKALEASEERFRGLFEHATLGFYRTAPDGEILMANPALIHMMGYGSLDQLMQHRVTEDDFAHGHSRNAFLVRMAQDGVVRGMESAWRLKDGRVIHVRESARVVLGEDGRPQYYEGTVEDITDRCKAEEALHQRTAELAASRQIFAALFRQNMAAMALSTWPDGELVDVNPAWEQMLILDRSEVLGRLVTELGIFSDMGQVHEVMGQLKTTGIVEGFEVTLRDRSGMTHRVLWSGQVSRIGDRDYLISSAVDISSLHQAMEALRASEAQNRAMVSALPDLVFVLSDTGRFLQCHAGEGTEYLQAPEQFLGRTFMEILPAELGIAAQACFDKVRREGQAQRLEYELELPQGRRSYESRMVPMGQSQVMVVARDVTDRVEAQQALQNSERRLLQAQKMESLGSLAGGVAHDMNNVLGAIMALASAHAGRVEGNLGRALETITTACERGRAMIRRLLGFVRQDLEEIRVVDLNQLVVEEVRLLERTTFSRIELVMQLEEDLPRVEGDPSALSRALMNLCVNAVDAMPSGGCLRLRTARNGAGRVRLSVEDTGCGMAPEVMEKAFDPFFTTKPQGEGTGLGLPMVYATAKAHRGEVWMESHPGAGTKVVMELPAYAEAAPAVVDVTGPAAPAEGRGLWILLVDDDDLVRESMEALLGLMGHRIDTVASGEASLARLAQGPVPDLVIMDMNMPGLGGEGTLPLLRAQWPDLPLLLATGRADQRALDLARQWNAGLIAKPFTMEELQARLQQMHLA